MRKQGWLRSGTIGNLSWETNGKPAGSIGYSIYDDVDYSQKFAEPEIPDDAILMQSVVHPQSWIGGEPRTSDEYDYDY